MAEPGVRYPENALLVETVLQAVYGRGSKRFELLCDLSLDRRSRYPEKVLSTHASDCRLLEAQVVSDGSGPKRVRVSGVVQVSAWCKGRGGTFVVGDDVPFQRELTIGPGDDAEFQNERATVRLVGEVISGVGAIVKEGDDLYIRVPVYLELEGEIVGDRRVHAYVLAPQQAGRPPAPFLTDWSGTEEHDYD